MSASPRWLPLAAIALCGCEPQLTVDLTDGPTDSATEVVLDVTHVALLTAGNEVVRLPVADGTPVDLLLYRRGDTYRLLGSEGFDSGRYVGIALDFASTGSYVTRDDGAQVTINPPAGNDFAPIDVDVGNLDEVRLVIDLNLRFSLVDTGSGTYDLEPVWRAVQPGAAGAIDGAVAATVVESDGCRAGRPVAEGVAVYVFRGSGVTPGDYVGQADLIDAADVAPDGAGYRYSVHFLPAGDYTLALTCQADADDPVTDDAVTFEASQDVTVTAGGTAIADF